MFSSEEFGFVRLDDCLGDGQLDAAAEEEPRRRRARPRQGRPAGRAPGRLPHDPQGSSACVQPRPAGGQGTALRRSRPGHLGSGGPRRPDRLGRASTSTACRLPPSGPGLAAVDLAEWLVAAGMAFRDAHGLVGDAWCASRSSAACRSRELVEAHPDFGEQALEVLDTSAALRRRTTPGGTGPDAVAVQLERFRHRLAARRRAALRAGGVRHGAPRRGLPSGRREPRRLSRVFLAGDPSRWPRSSWEARATRAACRHGSSRWRPTGGPRTQPRTPSGARTARNCNDVWSTWAFVRVLHLRHALLRQRRLLAGGRSRSGSASGPGAPGRARGDGRAARVKGTLDGQALRSRTPQGAWRPEDLCSGPAKLCQAFGLDRAVGRI